MNAPQRRGATAAMTAGLSLPQPPRISINNSVFTLIDRAGNEMMCNLIDPQVGRYLDVIIVDANANKSKIFYEGAYNPQSSDPPLCWSDNGVAPSTAAITPQSPTCASCQWNVIGSETSALSGKPIKACQDRKKLACFVVGLPMTDLYQFQVTPASLKHLAAYGKWVSGHPNSTNTGPADVSDLITRLYFLPGQQGVVGYSAVGPIDQEANKCIDYVFSQGKTAEITGSDDQPISGLLPAPQPTPALAAPQQQWAQPAALPPPQQPAAQQWAPPPAQTPQAQPAQHFQGQPAPQTFGITAASPAQQPQGGPPGHAWSAVAQKWLPVDAQGNATQPSSAAPAAAYPAPSANDPYAVPGFLQRGPGGAGQGPAAGTAPVPQAQVQPAQHVGGAPQTQFSAPAQPAGPKGPRGGKRTGAGRKTADVQQAQQAAQQQPAQAFGATQQAPQPPQQAPFVQPQQPAPQAFTGGAAPTGQTQFGMAPAGAPTADMAAALDRAFQTVLPAR